MIAITEGALPVGNGEPLIGLKLPSAAIENADTLSEPKLVTYNLLPSGLTAPAYGAVPALNGEPLTGLTLPSEATENADTSSELLLVT